MNTESAPTPSRRDLLEMMDESVQWLFDNEFIFCDHKWIADDYGAPESGYMGVTCTKCGINHGEYLY